MAETAKKKAAPKNKKSKVPENVTAPQDFKKKKNRGGVMLELPSGVWVKARMVDLNTFIRNGNIPNGLLPIINDALKKGEFNEEELLNGEGDIDIETIKEMYQMMDDITCSVVVDPIVNPVPENEADRSDVQLYVDEFEEDDKMYLFNWSQGAVKDLESFRTRHDAGLAAVPEGSDPASETVDAAGAEA